MRIFTVITIMLFVILSGCNKYEGNINTVRDIEGNVYKTVMIGTQVWMAENLKVTKYNDGTPVPLVTNSTSWSNSTFQGYCWYNNNEAALGKIFGGLYNYFALSTARQICPDGWHVPSETEWEALIIYLGGDSIAGGKLKEADTIHWIKPNTGATNSSGFTALPGGYRSFNGTFTSMGKNGCWWSATESSATEACYVCLGNGIISISRTTAAKTNGFSVRCMKD